MIYRSQRSENKNLPKWYAQRAALEFWRLTRGDTWQSRPCYYFFFFSKYKITTLEGSSCEWLRGRTLKQEDSGALKMYSFGGGGERCITFNERYKLIRRSGTSVPDPKYLGIGWKRRKEIFVHHSTLVLWFSSPFAGALFAGYANATLNLYWPRYAMRFIWTHRSIKRVHPILH